MNSLRNNVRLVGFMGNDPQIKTFDSKRKLAQFSLATNERYKNREGVWVDDTQWHRLVMWGAQAAYAEKNLTKGTEISVEGKLTYRNYTDKEGVERYVTEVVVSRILVLTKKKEESVLAEG